MEFDPLPQQRLAIEAPLGPLLVVAGPGAGKTFCLIARINHLITTLGIAPQRICAVTFTNRAAEEIGVRLTHTLRDRAEAITRGTIHALCLALLREHTEAAGLRKGFGVADELYQKVILGRLHVPLEQRGPLLNRFGRHRVQAYELTADDARLYREYTGWLAQRNMLDFDDLAPRARTESPSVRKAAQRGAGVAVRGGGVGVPRRSRRGVLAARGSPQRLRGLALGMGRLRHTLSPAQDRRVPRGAALSCGDSLPAGARALARRRRRHQVRDRRAADRA